MGKLSDYYSIYNMEHRTADAHFILCVKNIASIYLHMLSCGYRLDSGDTITGPHLISDSKSNSVQVRVRLDQLQEVAEELVIASGCIDDKVVYYSVPLENGSVNILPEWVRWIDKLEE